MNVQEINETGHSIWGFVVTAMAMLMCSACGWMLWRMSRQRWLKDSGRKIAVKVRLRRPEKVGFTGMHEMV